MNAICDDSSCDISNCKLRYPRILVVAEAELEETLKCDICDFETKHEKGLNIHKRRKHSPKFKCESCENEFDSKRDLKIHKQEYST